MGTHQEVLDHEKLRHSISSPTGESTDSGDSRETTFESEVEARPHGFWKSLHRRTFVIALILTVLGNFLAFLPIILNPSLANVSNFPPSPINQLVVPGLFLAIAGSALLLYTLFSALYRSFSHYSSQRKVSFILYRKSLIPALIAGLIFTLFALIQPMIISIPEELNLQ